LNSKRASEPVSSQNLAQSMTICSSTRSSSAGVSVASLWNWPGFWWAHLWEPGDERWSIVVKLLQQEHVDDD
jgi:hypothetical protein